MKFDSYSFRQLWCAVRFWRNQPYYLDKMTEIHSLMINNKFVHAADQIRDLKEHFNRWNADDPALLDQLVVSLEELKEDS